MNTFNVSPYWHCKHEFDIHSIFPRADGVTYIPYGFDIHTIFPRITGNPVIDTIHDSKMNITDKHFLKWIRTNTFDHLHSQSEQILRMTQTSSQPIISSYPKKHWVTSTFLPSASWWLSWLSCGTPPRQYSSFTSPMPSRRHLAHHSSRFSLWQTFHPEEYFISPVCRSD